MLAGGPGRRGGRLLLLACLALAVLTSRHMPATCSLEGPLAPGTRTGVQAEQESQPSPWRGNRLQMARAVGLGLSYQPSDPQNQLVQTPGCRPSPRDPDPEHMCPSEPPALRLT